MLEVRYKEKYYNRLVRISGWRVMVVGKFVPADKRLYVAAYTIKETSEITPKQQMLSARAMLGGTSTGVFTKFDEPTQREFDALASKKAEGIIKTMS